MQDVTAETLQRIELTIGLQDEIRCRTSQLDDKRGGQDGYEIDEWLQAETEVIQQQAKAAAA